MKDLDGSGHRYELHVMGREDDDHAPASLQFLRKDFRDTLVITTPGVTNEEVLRVLIDRMTKMQAKLPCLENIRVLVNLQEALLFLEYRTRDRVARDVESTDQP